MIDVPPSLPPSSFLCPLGSLLCPLPVPMGVHMALARSVSLSLSLFLSLPTSLSLSLSLIPPLSCHWLSTRLEKSILSPAAQVPHQGRREDAEVFILRRMIHPPTCCPRQLHKETTPKWGPWPRGKSWEMQFVFKSRPPPHTYDLTVDDDVIGKHEKFEGAFSDHCQHRDHGCGEVDYS